MSALVIASLAAAVCLVLALCGFYKIKPALVQVEAALWKFITLSRSRHLGGARFPVGPETTQRPDRSRQRHRNMPCRVHAASPCHAPCPSFTGPTQDIAGDVGSRQLCQCHVHQPVPGGLQPALAEAERYSCVGRCRH